MDLIFTKSETGKSWVAEFEATADFNLHIERDKGGNLMLYQRTNGGGWDIVNDFANPRFGAIDYDCAALIYPKFVKVVSEVEPTYAAVTSAGEVTEIKSQDKSIEVTSNGTIDVTPDAGFAYLNSVKVKTNVAQSGEGGGSSASSVEYLDVSEVSYFIKQTLLLFSLYAKVPQGIIIDTSENGNQSILEISAGISPSSIVSSQMGTLGLASVHIDTFLSGITALGFDFSSKLVAQGQTMTIYEYFTMSGGKEIIDAIPRITEAEFYNLES